MAQLSNKYMVHRVDNGQIVEDAFVLRITKDPVGWLAAWEYAALTNNGELAEEMRQWLLQNKPTEDTLGTEGRLNREALGQVRRSAPQHSGAA